VTKKKPTKFDAKTHPPAAFARPLCRYKLSDKRFSGSMGWLLIDVIAVVPGVKSRDSKYVFPTYVCLALADDHGWFQYDISGADAHIELSECYEVVQ